MVSSTLDCSFKILVITFLGRGRGGVGEKKRMVSWELVVVMRKAMGKDVGEGKRMGKDVRERKRMVIVMMGRGQVGTREWGISWGVAGS